MDSYLRTKVQNLICSSLCRCSCFYLTLFKPCGLYYYYNYYTLCEFFTPAFVDGLLLESKWQHVSSGHQFRHFVVWNIHTVVLLLTCFLVFVVLFVMLSVLLLIAATNLSLLFLMQFLKWRNLLFICLSSFLVHFKNSPEYLIKKTAFWWDFYYRTWCWEVFSFVWSILFLFFLSSWQILVCAYAI